MYETKLTEIEAEIEEKDCEAGPVTEYAAGDVVEFIGCRQWSYFLFTTTVKTSS